MPRTAAALVIGNEILSGKVQDANTLALATALRAIGVDLRRVVVVPDEIDAIAGEVNALRAAHDYLFTSGGVGPTHDDVTIAAVARALGRRTTRHAGLEAMLRTFYGERCSPSHLRMADLVEGTELLAGAAPSWPTFVLGNIFILPGVPEIFRWTLANVREHLRRPGEAFTLRSVYTHGDEGEIKPWIDQVVARYPAVSVGSYPRFRDTDYSVRVTFDGRDAALVHAAAAEFAALLPAGLLVREE